jgi:hypothetical protein
MNDRLHPVFADLLAPYAPSVRYDVTIHFVDGMYSSSVQAISKRQAEHLALIDARMGSPGGTFFGRVISVQVEPEIQRSPGP